MIALSAVASLALVALPAHGAFAEDPPPEDTTTTTVAPDTTTTTLPPVDTTLPPESTTTTLPPVDTTIPTDTTTTTTGPAADTTTTTVPADPPVDLSPLEDLVSVPQFAYLSGSQRAVLQRLQDASDTFATRRFTLVAVAGQLAAARDVLKAARVREQAAIESEIFGLLGAALAHEDDDATTQVISALTTSDADPPVRALAHEESVVDVLDALAPRLESERKSATRARVQAQAAVAPLKALFAEQTRAATEALSARSDAEAAVTGEFGSDAGWRAQADGITASLVAEQAGQPDPSPFSTLGLPLPGAALSSPFGVRVDPLGNGAGMHPGLDLAAPSGTPIHAAGAGVVVMAGGCGGYGYCVVIDHGSSLATLYGHQSSLNTQVGAHVEAGDVIGFVGSTGKSTGPHLHFEVRAHGIPIDPVLALAA